MSTSSNNEIIYGIDDHPPIGETITLGLQHYLTMLGSTVAVPLFLKEYCFKTADPLEMAVLISTMFFVSGICTILQATWGNRLPIVQGGTFSFIGPTIAICGMAHLQGSGWELKMVHVQGAIIVGGATEALIGFTGLAGRMLKYIGPITIAPTITLIGISLFGAGSLFAGQDWGLAGITIVLIILFSQYLRNKARAFRMYPILLAIGVAWGLAILLTELGIYDVADPRDSRAVKWDNVSNSDWLGIPTPFQWGTPTFGMAAIVGMFAGFVASMIESIGDYYACARLAGAKAPDAKQVNRGIMFEGIGCMIAGIFGTGNGTTSYSENIGAIGLTKVAARRVVQAGAIMMIFLGLFPKFGAVFTTIPQPIVGGMFCALFGMIAAVGLSNLQFVDLNSARNLFIIGFALYMGLVVPEYVGSKHPNGFALGETWNWFGQMAYAICKSGMSVGAILAFTLDNTVPGTDEERGLITWRQQ
ncbi:MAG: xanthine permease [Myxococcales bacterium]|nr:xanthine permease [Myxococcales bacterium]